MGNSLLCVFLFLTLQKAALSEESCGATIKVSATEGGEVTLRVKESDIIIITWRRQSELTYIARTAPGKLYLLQDGEHEGRLKVTSDGSFIITKLHREDQGMYRAEVERRTSGQCVRLYDLQVSGAEEWTDYTGLNFARLILSACVFVTICCTFMHHLVSEVFRRDHQ